MYCPNPYCWQLAGCTKHKSGLDENPTELTWPASHYLFVENLEGFEHCGTTWRLFHERDPKLANARYASLYRCEPFSYRAGVILMEKPEVVPEGLSYEPFQGGPYVKFTLYGSYDQLPTASGRVFELVGEKSFQPRDDFNIEHYVNDPKITPAEELVTEILIPTQPR